MAKKDRLRKEKEEQLRLQKEHEKQEELLKSKKVESKYAQKYKKQGKKQSEPGYFLVLKFIQLLCFGYSGFFWGGVLVIAIAFDMINDFSFSTVSNWTAVWIILGEVLLCSSLILEFLKKYTVGFVASVVGIITYLYGVNQFILPIKNEIGDKYIVNTQLLTLDAQWMRRCYPIIIFTVISFAMFLIKLVKKRIIKKKEKEIQDNAPIKSIVSD